MQKGEIKRSILSVLVGLVLSIPILSMALEDKDIGPVVKAEGVRIETEVRAIPLLAERVELVPTVEEVVEEELIYLSEFKVTAYCSCKKCCGRWAKNRPVDEDGEEIVIGASGKRLVANYSIAVDPKVIPYGTKVYIDGIEYIAHDCGGAIKENRIDLYMASHQEAREWGVQYHDVYIVK